MAKKKASNVALWIIMLMLIAGLAGFGATNFGGSVRSVATVGDTEVSIDDYARALQSQMQQYQRLTGQPISMADARLLGFDRSALATLIGDAALENATASAGLSVGDDRVASGIQQSPAFRGLSGSFDREAYELTLRQNNLTPQGFEARMRDDLAAGIVRRAVLEGVEAPDLFVQTIFNFARETRDTTWIRLGADDLTEALPEPTTAQLEAFHSENPEMFTQQETRVISYAWLTPDMIVDQIEVDDDQLRALYESRSDEYQQPERRLVERLAFATEAEAANALSRVLGGETTFEGLVEDRGLALEDIDLGEVTASDLGAASNDVFALEETGIVGPLPSLLGPALFRVNAILSAQTVTFDEAREELAAEAAADRARRVIADQIGTIEDLLAGGASMDILAERTDMEAGQIEWRPEITDGIAAYDAFRSAAATVEVGAFADVIELDDGGIFTLSLSEVRPPELLSLIEVRSDVAAAWREAESGARLEVLAEKIAQELRAGREMASLDFPIETDRNLERQGFVAGTPPGFVDQVFDMAASDIRVLADAGEAWIVRLDAISAPDQTTEEATNILQQFSSETRDQVAQSLLAAFTQALLADTDVSVNQAALTAIHSQLQ